MVNTLTRKFVDVIKAYNDVQQKFKADIKRKVQRQVQIINPDASSDDIQNAELNADGGFGEIFKNAILKSDVSSSTRNAFVSVQDQYRDVLLLEKSAQQMLQMMHDFKVVIDEQGEFLERIDTNLQKASDHIDVANDCLEDSIKYQRKITKGNCCICFTVLAVIGIIILVVLATQGKLG